MTNEVSTPRTGEELSEVFDQVVILYAGGRWTPGSFRACSLICSYLGIRPSQIGSLLEETSYRRTQILSASFEAKRQMIRRRGEEYDRRIIERYRRRAEPVDHRQADDVATSSPATVLTSDGSGRLREVALMGPIDASQPDDDNAIPVREKRRKGKSVDSYDKHGNPVKPLKIPPKPEPVVKPGAKRRFMMRAKRKGVIPDHD